MPEIHDECTQVFQKAMDWIGAHRHCSAILREGLNINRVISLHKAVFREQWPAISLHRPFLRKADRPKTAKAFWKRMETEASNAEQGIFFHFQGRRWDHWSVIREINPEQIVLFDSEGKHPLQRKRCGYTAEDTAEYVIGSEYILLLRSNI